MRDAFGGVFMVQLLLVFIIIYVGFISISLNYSRAFRIKNYVIDYIEEVELSDIKNTDLSDNISLQTKSYGYVNESLCDRYDIDDSSTCVNGIYIKRSDKKNLYGVDHYYYTVYVPVVYNMGFLGSLLSLTNGSVKDPSIPDGTWYIGGETRVIVRN
ncbi:MAG: hypothetical protein IJO57_02185 [Bacilli bacterium]|nr:hypothetical protein [Bacilli bacterium]